MRNSKAHTWTERERLQQMKAHSRHKGLCRVSTGIERERRALESAEAGTIQQSPLPSLEQPWVQESPAAIEEVYAMPDIGAPGRNTS